MVQTINILGVKKTMSGIKNRYKISKKNKEIYDPEWKMTFSSEKERKEFLDAIAEAEEDVRCGRMLTSEEMWEYFRKEVGCDI